MVQKCVVYKKIRKCRRNLRFSSKFQVLAWRHNHSQSLVLVSQFCTPPEVKFHVFGTSKDGKGKSLPNFFFAILISKLWRFYWANKKICHIHFKRTMPEALLMLLNIQTGERRAWLYQRPISFRFMYRMLSWAQVITLKLNLTEQSQTWS